MESRWRIASQLSLCITLCSFFFLCEGQKTEIPPDSSIQQNHRPDLFIDPANRLFTPFFDRDKATGSPYLFPDWVEGSGYLMNHKRIPEPGEQLLFNFDKINSILYVLDRFNKIKSYPVDSVFRFEFIVGNTITYYEKIPLVSTKFFLIPMSKSAKGYSLYKRLFTKIKEADFVNAGYYTDGKKYDQYLDDYGYYLLFPGNGSYVKLLLKEKNIRRALKNESKLLDEFFALHENEINEASLLAIIQYINEKKYPDQE